MKASNHNHDIHRILNSLEKIERAEPTSGFEDRLFARIEQMPVLSNQLYGWIKWSVAAMLVMTMVNVFTMVRQQSTLQTATLSELWSSDETYTSFDIFGFESADEINLVP